MTFAPEQLPSIDACTAALRELAAQHVSSSSMDARHLADLVHRIADRIDEKLKWMKDFQGP